MAFPTHSFMFQSFHEDQDRLPPTSLSNLPSCPTQNFHGGAPYMMKRSMSFSGIENKQCDEGHGDDELSDDGSQLGEKKKRLNMEQVKALEKSFELGNKLEPERKLQLAKALGMQPRQIAIWFQNRRARWKTKQLEKDYEALKIQFETLKADNDALHAQNKRLHEELLALKGRDHINESATKGQKKENEGTWSNGSDNSSDINLEISRNPVIHSSLPSPNFKRIIPSTTRPTGITQCHQGSTRSDLQGLKLDDMVQVESFCNMFNGIDEQQHNFWPWTEQQQQFH